MSRKILCPTCGELKPMHPQDVVTGIQRRRKWIDLYITVGCDNCGEPLHAQFKALCETMWRGDEPEEWESVYGKVLP